MASLLCHYALYSTSRGSNWAVPGKKPIHRRFTLAARLGSDFLDFEVPAELAGKLAVKAEGFLYTLADAAANSAPDSSAVEATKQRDWLSGITDSMEFVLKVLKDGLSSLHVPYSYGFAIILLTLLVKTATFPLTKKQIESSLAVRSLQPQVKAIQERFSGDQEKIQLETARLYKVAGVNPFSGCLPTLATIPVWIGLYRALSNVANEGLLTEGFFWIPSLAGPTTIASRQGGTGTSWLFPFVDGYPPLGWSDTIAYLVLPVLLVLSQFVSAQILQPPQTNDPNQSSSQAVTKILPLMIGYFALSVPSGLSLYWFTNNVLSIGQQIWLQKLGGAKNPLKDFDNKILMEQPKIAPKSEEVTSAKKVSSSEERSEGQRPGERFRKLREEEAKRKKEREEQKKAEELPKVPNSNSVDIDNTEQVNKDPYAKTRSDNWKLVPRSLNASARASMSLKQLLSMPLART